MSKEIIKYPGKIANHMVNIYYRRIIKAIKLLEKYNDNEANYYVPVEEVLEILKGKNEK